MSIMSEVARPVQRERTVFLAKISALVVLVWIGLGESPGQACISSRPRPLCSSVQLRPAPPENLESLQRSYLVWTQFYYYPRKHPPTDHWPTPPTLSQDKGTKSLPPSSAETTTVFSSTCGQLPISENVANPSGQLQVGAMVGGEVVKPNQWPWLARVVMGGRFQCGGVLLNDRWVMTAAHCFMPGESVTVTLAEHDWSRFEGVEEHKSCKQLFHHEQFTEEGDNDITLILLSSPVRLSNRVAPICLPQQGQVFGKVRCTVAGWGDESEMGWPSRVPKQVEFEIVPIEACRAIIVNQVLLGAGHLCVRALKRASGTCLGDSGGPLMCRLNGSYYVLGIASFALGGCDSFLVPEIFTRVAHYVGWIHDKMARRL